MQKLILGKLEVSALGMGTMGLIANLGPAADKTEVLPVCEEFGSGFVSWAPLGTGFLTGIIDAQRLLPTRERTPLDYAKFLVEQLDDTNVVLLVAEQNEDVIGYAYGRVEGYDYMSLREPAGMVHDIILDAAYRGQGIRRCLLALTITELERRGAPRFVLSAASRNESAQRLFASVGFRSTTVQMTREVALTAVAPQDETWSSVSLCLRARVG